MPYDRRGAECIAKRFSKSTPSRAPEQRPDFASSKSRLIAVAAWVYLP